MVEVSTDYTPFPKQDIAHQSTARYLLFGGAVGPGKTRAMVEQCLAYMLKWPGIPCLIVRFNEKDVRLSTMIEWERVVPKQLYDKKYGGSHSKTLGLYTFPNGSSVRFGGTKNIDDIMSSQFAWIGVDEAHEVPEDHIRKLDTRLRWTAGHGTCDRAECKVLENAREHPEHPRYQLFLCSNPHPGWLKARFYDPWKYGKERPNHQFILSKTEDNLSLPPDYYQNLYDNNNPVWVRRMLEGDWSAFEGMTFDMWSRAIHQWTDALPDFKEVTGGIDWGHTTKYAHRTVATVTGRMRNGKRLTFECYSEQGPASTDLFEWVGMMTRRYKMRRWTADASQPRAIQALAQQGLPIYEADRYQGARGDGVNVLARLLFEEKLYVHQKCTRLISGIESYHEVPEGLVSMTGAAPSDPVRHDDDEVDAWRYDITGSETGQVSVTNLQLAVLSPKRREHHAGKVLEARRNLRHERLKEFLEREGEI